VRPEEGEVVVAAVPQDDVSLLFGRAQNLLVVDPGVHDVAALEMRLVLLALLDGGVVALEIGIGGIALADLCAQVAVGHGVAHHDDAPPELLQERRHVTRGLALARAVRTAPTATTGRVLASIVLRGPRSV